MEKYLELFAQKYPDDLHIIQLDNGPQHQSLNMSIPESIIFFISTALLSRIKPHRKTMVRDKKKIKMGNI